MLCDRNRTYITWLTFLIFYNQKKKILTHLICQLIIQSKWHFPKKKKSLLIYIYIYSLQGKKEKKKKEKETTTLGSYFFQIPIIRFYNFLSKKKKERERETPKVSIIWGLGITSPQNSQSAIPNLGNKDFTFWTALIGQNISYTDTETPNRNPSFIIKRTSVSLSLERKNKAHTAKTKTKKSFFFFLFFRERKKKILSLKFVYNF